MSFAKLMQHIACENHFSLCAFHYHSLLVNIVIKSQEAYQKKKSRYKICNGIFMFRFHSATI